MPAFSQPNHDSVTPNTTPKQPRFASWFFPKLRNQPSSSPTMQISPFLFPMVLTIQSHPSRTIKPSYLHSCPARPVPTAAAPGAVGISTSLHTPAGTHTPSRLHNSESLWKIKRQTTAIFFASSSTFRSVPSSGSRKEAELAGQKHGRFLWI